jgi:ribosomal protein S18 acetylase RimI-like enzyme
MLNLANQMSRLAAGPANLRFDPRSCLAPSPPSAGGTAVALTRLHDMATSAARLTDARVQGAIRFLEPHLDTSIFLLASLGRYGPHVTDIANSGDYYEVTVDNQIAAVFACTRRGHLLAQTGGRRDLASEIARTCQTDGFKVTGVIAEWDAAESLHQELSAIGAFAPSYLAKNLVLRRQMRHDDFRHSLDHVRRLQPSESDAWIGLYETFLSDQGSAAPPNRDALRGNFERRSGTGFWWGAFDGPLLVGIVAVDEVYRNVSQVGGLYVRPEARRRGIGTALMAGLQRDCLADTRLDRMVLFVRSDNLLGHAFYEAQQFEGVGHFGLIW